MTTRITNVRLALLLVMGLILLTVAGVWLYDRLVEPPVAPPATGLPVDGITARAAFDPAAALAAQWQDDARLAAVSCQWPEVGMQQRDDVEWAFQFFSPATQRLALITVAGGAARVLRDSLSPYEMVTFSAAAWRVDSDQALRTWWDNGGRTVVARRPDATLVMQLRPPDESGGDPVWTVIGLVFGTESTATVVVNASSGALIEP